MKKNPNKHNRHRQARSGSPSEKENFCEFVLQDLATAQNDQNLFMMSLIRGMRLSYIHCCIYNTGTDPVSFQHLRIGCSITQWICREIV